MKSNSFFLILAIFLLCSCAGNILISNRGCQNLNGHWGEESSRNNDFLVKEKIWYFSSVKQLPKKISVQKILKRNGIECSSLKTLRVEIKQDFLDILYSFIPFASRSSLFIKGKKF